MKKQLKQQQTPIKKIGSKKNNLADRLFDRPDLRIYSQEKRPKIFSNEAQQNKLRPNIRINHSKRLSSIQSLPPIDIQKKQQKLKTQTNVQDQIYLEEKVSDLKKLWHQSGKKDQIFKLKNKQNFQKTRIMDSRMNRTLTQSREIVHMMEKMSGKHGQKKQQNPFKDIQVEVKKKQQYKLVVSPAAKNIPQNIQHIDQFVYLSEEGRVSEYQFYYMTKQQSNDYYNMEIINYQAVQDRKIKDYFTLSGHGITKYEDARPIEFLSLSQWDSQRKQFNQIKQLQFFKKFRKWKSLKKWITILSKRKMKKISDILQQQLFFLHPQYRNMLLSHTQACYQIEQFKFIQILNDPLQLNAFCQLQQKNRNLLITYMKDRSKDMHKNTTIGFKKIVKDLQATFINQRGNQQPTQKKQSKNDQKKKIFAQLGFSSNLSFGNKSTIRAQFMRFIKLAYLLDFITIQSLGKLFISNVQRFKLCLIHSNQQSQSLPLPQGLKFGSTCSKEDQKNIYQETQVPWRPIFSLSANITDQKFQQEIHEQETTFEDIRHSFLNFDIIGFIITGSKDQFQYDEDTILKKRYHENLSNSLIKIQPKKDIIIDKLLQFFKDTSDSIQVIDKWVKNPQLKIYTQALQQWDQIIGDNWDKNDQRYLNPSNWINDNISYRTFKNHVKQSISNTYQTVTQLVRQHNQIINWYWRLNNTDFNILSNPDVEQQSIVFQTTYNKLIESEQYLEKYLLERADFYIYSLDFSKLRKKMLKNKDDVIKSICYIYADIIKTRCKQLKLWFSKSIQNLSGLIIRIQQFVDQKLNLQIIINKLPKKKKQLQQMKILLKLLQSSKWL